MSGLSFGSASSLSDFIHFSNKKGQFLFSLKRKASGGLADRLHAFLCLQDHTWTGKETDRPTGLSRRSTVLDFITTDFNPTICPQFNPTKPPTEKSAR